MIVIGVCFLPSLYAWFNVAANIDPYSNTCNIKVAIANTDIPASERTTTINAGEELVSRLKENHDLDWQFVTKEQAIDGVTSGKYYAAIVIPENFSSNIISILSGTIKKPVLEYYMNEKKNAIAPKITDTGAETIQLETNNNFAATAAESITDALHSYITDISSDFKIADENIHNDLGNIQTTIKTCQDLIHDFHATAENSSKLIQDTSVTIDALETAVTEIKENLKDTDGLVSDARNSVGSFSDLFMNEMADSNLAFLKLFNHAAAELTSVDSCIQGISDRLKDQIQYLHYIMDTNNAALEALKNFHNARINSHVDALTQKNQELQSILDALNTELSSISKLSSHTSGAGTRLADLMKDSHNSLLDFSGTLNRTILPKLNHPVDSFSALNSSVLSTVSAMAPSVSQLKSILGELDGCLTRTTDLLNKTDLSIENVNSDLSSVLSELTLLEQSKAYQDFLSLKQIDASAVSDFMSSPVTINTTVFFKVKNYGSAMTPFYTNLALWVGGIILVSILKQEVDMDTDEKGAVSFTEKRQACMGRYLLFLLIGIIQGIIVCAGDLYLLKIQYAKAVPFLLLGVLCSVVYVSLVFVITLAFKHIGKAICVILVILQIPGSSGTYPIEMMPDFFQKLCPFLPFTYGIRAMRECIAGFYGSIYLQSVCRLLLFLIVAAVLGFGLHPLIINLNYVFDQKIAETDLILGEEFGQLVSHPKKDPLYQALLIKNAPAFEKNYRKRVRYGFLAMSILPLIFLLLMFNLESKLVYLILWIGSLLLISFLIILNEYIHDTIENHFENKQVINSKEKEKER